MLKLHCFVLFGKKRLAVLLHFCCFATCFALHLAVLQPVSLRFFLFRIEAKQRETNTLFRKD